MMEKIKSALKLQEPSHQSSMNKFAIFCRANAEMPYYYKSTVMDAAVTSSILYGCETWFCKKPLKVISTYNQLLKCLLGVRLNTSINLCLVKSGKQPARFIIRHRLKTFLEGKMRHRDMEEPFQIAFEMCKRMNLPGFRFLQDTINRNNDDESLEKVALSVRNRPDASKFITYRTELNPELNVHNIYGKSVYIHEYLRISFTRLRLMSHNLRIETGRWSRINVERRVCQCDSFSF